MPGEYNSSMGKDMPALFFARFVRRLLSKKRAGYVLWDDIDSAEIKKKYALDAANMLQQSAVRWKSLFDEKPLVKEFFVGKQKTIEQAAALVSGDRIEGISLYRFNPTSGSVSIEEDALASVVVHIRPSALMWTKKIVGDRLGGLEDYGRDGPLLSEFYANWGKLSPPLVYRSAWNLIVVDDPSSIFWQCAYDLLVKRGFVMPFSIASRLFADNWRDQFAHYLLRESTTVSRGTLSIVVPQEDLEEDGSKALQLEYSETSFRIVGTSPSRNPDLDAFLKLHGHLTVKTEIDDLSLVAKVSSDGAKTTERSNEDAHIQVTYSLEGSESLAGLAKVAAASSKRLSFRISDLASELFSRIFVFYRVHANIDTLGLGEHGRAAALLVRREYATVRVAGRRTEVIEITRHANAGLRYAPLTRYLVIHFDVKRLSGTIEDGGSGVIQVCKQGRASLDACFLYGGKVARLSASRDGSSTFSPLSFVRPKQHGATMCSVASSAPSEEEDDDGGEEDLEAYANRVSLETSTGTCLFGFDVSKFRGTFDSRTCSARIVDPLDLCRTKWYIEYVVLILRCDSTVRSRTAFRIAGFSDGRKELIPVPNGTEALGPHAFPIRLE